jgi:hypothetical protein
MKILGVRISKFRRNIIVFFLVGTAISPLIGLIINSEAFRQDSIDQKYCYYFKNDSITEVYSADNIEKAYQIIAYFYCTINNDKKGIIIGDNMYEIKKIRKVEILEYTRDSLLAKIRYKYFSKMRGGMIIETISYVPAFTLHDTLPIGIKASNADQMQDISE